MYTYRLLHRISQSLLVGLSLVTLVSITSAQQRAGRALQLGVQASGILATPSSEFTGLPGIANCIGSLGAPTSFTGGSGGGFAGGVLVGLSPLPGMSNGFVLHLGFDVGVGYL